MCGALLPPARSMPAIIHNLRQGGPRGVSRVDASAMHALRAVADGFCFSDFSQGSSSRERPLGTQPSTLTFGSCRCHRLGPPGRTQTASAPGNMRVVRRRRFSRRKHNCVYLNHPRPLAQLTSRDPSTTFPVHSKANTTTRLRQPDRSELPQAFYADLHMRITTMSVRVRRVSPACVAVVGIRQ
jgi:hypothetical protein